MLLVVAAGVYLLPADPEGDVVAAGVWKVLPASGLVGRSDPSVVWTRRAMIVWGGEADSGVRGDGASYDLASDTWTPLAPAQLSPRRGQSSVWTGASMVIYGGVGIAGECPRTCALGDGAAYDPNSNTWTPIAPAPLVPRSGHSALWVQNRMVIWGGAAEDGAALADGAFYDPATDSWTALPASPLEARVGHRAVGTTHRMLVWGGSSDVSDGARDFADGAVYSPVTNTWSPMAPGPLSARTTVASVWTGKEMLVWGGYGRSAACTRCPLGDGAAYDVDTNSWSPMAPSPLSGRGGHRAVWTGRDMLVWGGSDVEPQSDGALFGPAGNSWARVVPGPLPARQEHAVIWTGRQLLVWGGGGASAKLADGAVLTLRAS